MWSSSDKKLNTILRFIGADTMMSVEQFISIINTRSFLTFESEKQVVSFFDDYINTFFLNSLNVDVENIRYYTGIAFNGVNAILREIWNYDRNGILTEDKRKECIKLSDDLSEALSKVPNCLPTNIKSYRGVGLSSFKTYGINSIRELKNMIGQYYYESGFMSTSLLRERSFFNRELEWHDSCNIEIEYYIPQECNDGLPLITSELSYSKVQSEFLINKGSLSKIIDVDISEDETKAYIKAILVPKKIWDLSYAKQQMETQRSK